MDNSVKWILAIVGLLLFLPEHKKSQRLSDLRKKRSRKLFYVSNGKVIPRSELNTAKRMTRAGYGKVYAVWAYNANEARDYIQKGKAETVSGLSDIPIVHINYLVSSGYTDKVKTKEVEIGQWFPGFSSGFSVVEKGYKVEKEPGFSDRIRIVPKTNRGLKGINAFDLKTAPLWELNPSLYLSQMGIHEPWIAEIAPTQYARMSKRAKAQYDKKRHDEWEASASGKRNWSDRLWKAYNEGQFTLDTPGVSKDTRDEISYRQRQESKDDKEAQFNIVYQSNSIKSIDDLKIGDIVWSVMLSEYGTVEKKFKNSVSFKMLEPKPYLKKDTFTVNTYALQRMKYDDLKDTFNKIYEKPIKEETKPTPKPKIIPEEKGQMTLFGLKEHLKYEIWQVKHSKTQFYVDPKPHIRENGTTWYKFINAKGEQFEVPDLHNVVKVKSRSYPKATQINLFGLSDKPKLVGYTWLTYIGDKFSRYDGGFVAGRISDWSKAETSKGSGRHIVHVYHIQEPDGTVNPYGKQTALKRLGYDSPRRLDKQAENFLAEAMNKKHVIEAELDEMSRVKIGSKPSEASQFYLQQQNQYRSAGNYIGLDKTVVYKRGDEYLTTVFYPERVEALAQMGFKPYVDNTTHEKFDKQEAEALTCNSIKKGCLDMPTQMTLFGGVRFPQRRLQYG